MARVATEAHSLWLPGFGDHDDQAIPDLFADAPTVAPEELSHSQSPVIARSAWRPQRKGTAVRSWAWPTWSDASLDGLSTPVAKFEANIAAIEMLRRVETNPHPLTDDERRTLIRFTGWGGLPGAFNSNSGDPGWRTRAHRLQSLLSAEEHAAALASVNTSHYTDPMVVHWLWRALQTMGFDGGSILEPSAGVGHFIGCMPQAIARKSRVTAIELDDIAARILRALYAPHGVDVRGQATETVDLAEGSFDLVLSNIPFGSFGVTDGRNRPFSRFSIHNWFVGKGLELLREGGLMCVITSTFLMDESDRTARAYFASQADLLTAFRLPAGTFAGLGGTDVQTDVVVLRKRKVSVAMPSDAPWLELTFVPPALRHPSCSDPYMRINAWFTERPSNVVGLIDKVSNGYGHVPTARLEGPLRDALARVSALVPVAVYRGRETDLPTPTRPKAPAGARPGSYVVADGRIHLAEGGELVDITARISGAARQRVAKMCEIRDCTRDLLKAQLEDGPDGTQASLRRRLNDLYDRFVARFGCLSSRANALAFRRDPDYPLLLSLEHYDDEQEAAHKAAIFERRTVAPVKEPESADTPEEALALCMQWRGKVDVVYIAKLLQGDEADVVAALLDAGLVFQDPVSEVFVTADAYLSGDVKRKLNAALTGGPEFKANVVALEKVIPADLPPGDIEPRLGAVWIPSDVVERFIVDVLRVPESTVRYLDLAGTWSVKVNEWQVRQNVVCTQEFGTGRMDAVQLLQSALNVQTPTVRDPHPEKDGVYIVNREETLAAREKLGALKARFAAWCYEDQQRRDRLCRIYNDLFNCLRARQFDGSHLRLPGFSHCFELHPSQRNAIWRIVQSGNTGLFHAVGAGKTAIMVAATMELRRLGLANKPVHVVPNHMLMQYTAEFVRLYPCASVLMATKDDLAGDRRREFVSRVATGDWDAVVMTQSTFELLPMSQEHTKEHITGIVRELEWAVKATKADDRSNRIVKQLERMKKVWRVRLERLDNQERKDDFLHWEALGIDFIAYDEAHLAKNLWRHTKMSRIAGLPLANSQRAFDLYLKTRYTMSLYRDQHRGVVLATATPVANSMAEIHTFQRYLQPNTLRALGLEQFDAWAATFGETVTALELAPDGSGYRLNTRFARFINVPDLMAVFCDVSDVRTREMLNLPVPTLKSGKPRTVSCRPSSALKSLVKTLVERAERLKTQRVDPRVDNMLKITNDGRKAALDMRLINPLGPQDPEGKVARCAQEVHRIWSETADHRRAQLVFCDLSTPKSDAQFSVYDAARETLVGLGIPEGEIAFVHDAETDTQKARLFKKVRDGVVRVLFGSTPRMGVGTNVQDRLVALHELDCPWRPCDVEQREGRILRQGNRCDEVEIIRYVTEGSFDAYSWQTVLTKAKFIAQVMSGDKGLRSVEDVELATLSYAEVKALASGNPTVIEKAGVDAEVARYSSLFSVWRNQRFSNESEVASLPMRIESLDRLVQSLEEDARRAEHVLTSTDLRAEIDGLVVHGREATGDALRAAVRRARHAGVRRASEERVGQVGDLQLWLLVHPEPDEVHVFLRGSAAHDCAAYQTGPALYSELLRVLQGMPDRWKDAAERLQSLRKKLQQLQDELRRPFEYQDRLADLLARQRELAKELDLDQDEVGSQAVEAEDQALAA
jgi:N12 class adenine-specific DNA methylase